MRLEKFEDYMNDNFATLATGKNWKNLPRLDLFRLTFKYQEKKLLDVLDYISLIGHQKELDYFLKKDKGWGE